MSVYDTVQPNTLAPTAEQVAPAVNTPMTSSQANQVLTTYGVNPTAVLSSTNVANTVSSATPAPDDLLGIRANITKELGLDVQQTAYQNALAAAKSRLTELNQSTALMEGQRVNLGVIRGEQAQARTLAVPEIQALQDQANLEQEKLNALTTERDYRVGVAESNINFTKQLKLQYAGAGISYGDSMDTIEKKITKFAKDQKKEAYKDSLKQIALEYGIKTKGKSTKELEKEIAKYNKNAKDEAKKIADLQYNTALEQYNKLKEANSGGGNSGNPASYFFNNSSNQSSRTSNDALGAFGY
jgi:hypothetical protein